MISLLIEDYCKDNGLSLNSCVSNINLRKFLHENLSQTYTGHVEMWQIEIDKVINILIENISSFSEVPRSNYMKRKLSVNANIKKSEVEKQFH